MSTLFEYVSLWFCQLLTSTLYISSIKLSPFLASIKIVNNIFWNLMKMFSNVQFSHNCPALRFIFIDDLFTKRNRNCDQKDQYLVNVQKFIVDTCK